MAEDASRWAEQEESLDEFPDVPLDWARDDEEYPAKLTIFDPREQSFATAWLTADYDAAVSLEQTR